MTIQRMDFSPDEEHSGERFSIFGGSTPLRVLNENEQLLAGLMNSFGFRLLHGLAGAGGNVVISPFSIARALAMLLGGARGETRATLAGALGLEGLSPEATDNASAALAGGLRSADPAVTLSIADSIWYQQGFAVDDAFIERCAQSFDAEVRGLNFADTTAAEAVNAWVRERTAGRITGVLPEVPFPGLLLVIVDALYFKAPWSTPFDPELTSPETFTLGDGTAIECPMMCGSRMTLYRRAAVVRERGAPLRQRQWLYRNASPPRPGAWA